MTGVPGGDVTLHAAITETLSLHPFWGAGPCDCGTIIPLPADPVEARRRWAAHQAERVLAVLADRLPHTPPDQLAALIGGTVHQANYVNGIGISVIGPEEFTPFDPELIDPTPPSAAPEPRQDGHDVSCERHLGGYPTCACDDRADPLPAAPTEEPNRA